MTANDFPDLDALKRRILGFRGHRKAVAEPFEWNFIRRDLEALMRSSPSASLSSG